MRHATQEVGWLLTEAGALMGFTLGFDYCAEHEYGVRYFRERMGIPEKDIPIGIEERTMTRVPGNLGFVKYDYRSPDKRSKRTWPAAVLHMCRTGTWRKLPTSGAALAKSLGMSFHLDPVKDKRYYDPARHDILCHWSSEDGFALHVRGQENVNRLEALHAAMTQCKVSLADPVISGFVRKAMSLVMNEVVSPELAEEVRARDLAFKRLHDAADATGVYRALEDAGLKYHALSPRWREGEGSELLFFLNPHDQRKFDFGWFRVDELNAWARGEGPVVDGKAVKELLKAQDTDYHYHLVMGLGLAGLHINSSTEAWADAAKTVPALRLLVSEDSRARLPDGVYTTEQLEPYLTLAREARAREKAETEAKLVAQVAASAPEQVAGPALVNG